LPAADGKGRLDVSAQFDQADLANLGKGAVAAAAAAAAEAGGVGVRVRRVLHRAVHTHESPALVVGARRLRRSQGPNHLVKKPTDGSDAQALSGFAQVAARRRPLARPQTPRLFEHLSNRQMRKYAHSQRHPQHHGVRESAHPLLAASRFQQGC
jgi:hypothetical protein